MTSFVPKGRTDLIAENSVPFIIEEESVTEQKKVSIADKDEKIEKLVQYKKTLENEIKCMNELKN